MLLIACLKGMIVNRLGILMHQMSRKSIEYGVHHTFRKSWNNARTVAWIMVAAKEKRRLDLWWGYDFQSQDTPMLPTLWRIASAEQKPKIIYLKQLVHRSKTCLNLEEHLAVVNQTAQLQASLAAFKQLAGNQAQSSNTAPAAKAVASGVR